MSQITRCPHCATTFKVVADQLRISDGWVRCGQCKEVFDASEHLLASEPEHLLPEMLWQGIQPVAHAPEVVHLSDSTRDGALESQPPASMPPSADEQHDPSASRQAPASKDAEPRGISAVHVQGDVGVANNAEGSGKPIPLSTLLRRESLAQPPIELAATQEEPEGYELPGAEQTGSIWQEDAAGEVQAESAHVPDSMPEPLPDESSAAAEGSDDLADPSDRADHQMLEPVQSEPLLADEAALMPVVAQADPAQTDAAVSPGEPSFVAAARRKALWRRPVVRGTLVMLGLILLLALTVQLLLHDRDLMAARHPAARVLLERICQPLGCTLDAPRRIDAVVIDSSSFLKARNDDASYELQLGIKNNANYAVAMPALELTLTDSYDQTVLRRVLMRDEMGAPVELAPGATWTGAVSMQVMQGASQVAGYRLLTFYP